MKENEIKFVIDSLIDEIKLIQNIQKTNGGINESLQNRLEKINDLILEYERLLG